MQKRTWRLIVAAATAAALVLSACGDSDDGAVTVTDDTTQDTAETRPERTAAEVVRNAATAPTLFESSTMEMVIAVDGEEFSRIAGTGSADGLNGDMTVAGAMGEFRMIYVGGAYYYQFPDLPPGIEWVSMSAEEVAGASGIDPTAGSMDAGGMLEVLSAVSDEIEELGTDELFGVTVDGYRATISREALVAGGVDSGMYTEGLGDDMSSLLPDTFEMEVWIDHDGLPRRQTWSMDMVVEPGAAPSRFDYRVDYPEWGRPLEVSAPPAEVTASMAELMGDTAGAD